MRWQRGYKLSLPSQVLLFSVITTVHIYLGQDWVFSEISKICHERSWQVQSCAFNSKKQLNIPCYVCEVSTWAGWAKPHLLQHKTVQSLVSKVPNLRKPSGIKSFKLCSTSGIYTRHPHLSEPAGHTSEHSRSPSHCFLPPLKLSGWFVLAGLEFCHLVKPKDYQPYHTCRQDSTNNDLRLPQCNIHCLCFQNLHSNWNCIKLKCPFEVFCTYKVWRFVRPLKTPSAMWLMWLSPRFSFSNKPSPTKADSLRRVSWLYDKSLEIFNIYFKGKKEDYLLRYYLTRLTIVFQFL